jgi:hypothetical protein
MAAARARREADAATGEGSADTPAPPTEPASTPEAPEPNEDEEKAARIAAMKEKIEALKRQRGGS